LNDNQLTKKLESALLENKDLANLGGKLKRSTTFQEITKLVTNQINEEILEQNSSSSDEWKKLTGQSPTNLHYIKSAVNLDEYIRDSKQMLENKQIKCKYMNTREKWQEEREMELDVITKQRESPARPNFEFGVEKFDFEQKNNTESLTDYQNKLFDKDNENMHGLSGVDHSCDFISESSKNLGDINSCVEIKNMLELVLTVYYDGSDEPIKIECDKNDTILEVKNKIIKKLGLDNYKMRLMLGSKKLLDFNTMMDCNIVSDADLRLVDS